MEGKWWTKESLVKFQSPSTIMICGPTGSSKTYLNKQMLQHTDGTFNEPPSKIIFCYDTWQSMFDELKQDLIEITFHQGLPNEEQFKEWSDVDGHKLLVIGSISSTERLSERKGDVYSKSKGKQYIDTKQSNKRNKQNSKDKTRLT